MPNVNLIQEQRSSSRQRERKSQAYFLFFALAAGISICTFCGLAFETVSLARQEVGLRHRANQLKPSVQEIESTEREIASLNPRLTTLSTAQEGTVQWMTILKHLASNTPEGLWLTSTRCSQNDPTKPVQIAFIGLSQNQESVGEFILRLQACDQIENVVLKFTQERTVGTTSGIEFEVNADLAGSAEKKDTKKDEDKEAGA